MSLTSIPKADILKACEAMLRKQLYVVFTTPTNGLEPVMAVINAPTQGQVGQPITFDGSTSTANAGIASYTWSFSDGSTANGAVIQHSFAAPGSYDVVLTVTDVDGNIADASIVIAIQ